MNNSANHFDRSGEYYPLVMSYVTSLHGLLEMFSRAAVDTAQGVILKEMEGLSPEERTREQLLSKFKNAQKTPLLGNLVLRRSLGDYGVSINTDDFTKELFEHRSYLLETGLSNYPGRMLLVFAYEIKKQFIATNSFEKDPLWQFFRHCRNAAAHNGKFFFKADEPKYPAMWNGFEIKKEMANMELFKKEETSEGLMSLGDPIVLLWDIEQKYFI